ncbi:MAG: putative transporter substrate-binding protein [Herbaspirillum sp.]|jgi:iron(III) transport system substrate-binding protein|nr:putative transporter substrate-binding protein [Herbaspirillum sp.]
MKRLFFLPVLGFCSLFFLCAGFTAAAQNKTAAAAIGAYDGPDRMERLIAGAKKEGTLNLYTSIAASDVSLMTGEFEKKYGVKVVVWRAANDKVLQRTMAEQAARRNNVDAVQIASLELEALARENALQEENSPAFAHLMPGAVPRHRQWAAHYLNVWVQAYNTQKVRQDELPKTYADLLDPRWKGKLGIEANNEEWFYSVVEGMGESAGLKFFRDLVAGNGLSVREGHSLLNNMVISGEVPLALTVYNYMPEQARAKGAPIDWFVIEPAIARANGIAVSRQAPHPYAATLFYEFVLSQDVQRMMSKNGYVPTDRNVASPLKNIPISLIDTGKMLDSEEKWTSVFNKVIKGGR